VFVDFFVRKPLFCRQRILKEEGRRKRDEGREKMEEGR
jgi:hypothetical protein